MEDAREARRRRIVERGSDRLAFITGEARSLPPPSPPPPPPPPPRNEDSQRTAASLGEDDVTGFELHKHQASNRTFGNTAENNDMKELLQKCESSRDLPKSEEIEEFSKCKMGKQFPGVNRNIEAPTKAQDNVGADLLTTSIAAHIPSDQVVDTTTCRAPRMNYQIFTSNHISRSISATENIRTLCAVTIALLVVLSGYGFSLGGSLVRNLISFRPLVLVLLTDVTVAIGHMLLTEGSRRCDKEEEAGGRRTGQEGNDGLGRALEAGLVFQKALSAAFMDCSICAVIIISGLVL